VVAVLSCWAALAIAAPQCTQQTTRGNWGFTCEAGQLKINYVIFDQGDAIKGLPTNSGGVLTCSLKRINRSEGD